MEVVGCFSSHTHTHTRTCTHTCTHTQEEYDIVTNDYEKAKSLFAGTQVKVFKKGMSSFKLQHILSSLFSMWSFSPSPSSPLWLPCTHIPHHHILTHTHSHICLFSPHPVLEEVENQIRKLREDLKKKLFVLPSTLEEQRKLIK